jgi:uncharacterized membrane protein YeaQ/YmgE (transglycosylase-associated protein family)
MSTAALLFAWVVLGVVAGALSRFLMPGREPLTLGGAVLVGLIGSLVGGFLSWGVTGMPDGRVHAANWVLPVVCTILAVTLFGLTANRKMRRF